MQDDPHYDDVVAEVCEFLARERDACVAAGIARDAIVLDPGLGFGKGLAHNMTLLRELPRFAALDAPLLVGVSRKSFIGRILGRPVDERLYGGLGLAALAVAQGARIIRTHDVARNARCDRHGECGSARNRQLSRYFGTDGLRGRVGAAPMTVDFALRLASAAARVLAPGGGRVLIGKDTRVSGYMFESALEAGFVAAGVDVMLIGPLPTPGIAYMTQRLDCSFGVVISASHNSYQDNGIKFFDATGSKLSDEAESDIETSARRAGGDPGIAAAGQGHPHRPQPHSVSAVLRLDDSVRHESAGFQDRHRLRQRRGLQGGAARTRRPGRRDRAHRLLAERPQHQRWLRIDGAGAAAADGSRSARAARDGARRRRGSGGDGRRARALRGRRSAALHPGQARRTTGASSRARWSER